MIDKMVNCTAAGRQDSTSVVYGEVVAWAWDFGDGASSTEQDPSHTYAEAGTFTVSLTVEDDEAAPSDPASQSVEITAPPPSGGVVTVFVTSESFSGDQIGGLEGADEICKAAAADAGLSGTDWTAWLSDSTGDAIDRIPDGQYQDMAELLIAEDKAELTSGLIRTPIGLSENSEAVYVYVWTGTGQDGTAGDENCKDWTDATAVAENGYNQSISVWWTRMNEVTDQFGHCHMRNSIYCFGGVN